MATAEAEPTLSIREQLLLAQAVYQAQFTKQTEKKVNWEQVIELIQGYQQARKTQDWLWHIL
jgi:hypothetical protein